MLLFNNVKQHKDKSQDDIGQINTLHVSLESTKEYKVFSSTPLHASTWS